MIYKQRLFSKKDKGQENNQQTQQAPQENASQPKPERKHTQYNKADEGIAAAEKERLEGYKKLNGNTAYIDENGKRVTAENLEHEYDTKVKNSKTLKRLEKEAKINKKNKENKIKKRCKGILKWRSE